MSFDDAFYREMEGVANELVGDFGTMAFILRHNVPVDPIDPLRPWEGNSGQTVVAYPCKIIIGSFSDIELIAAGQSTAQYLDHKIMIAKEGLEIEPVNSDMLQLSDHDRAFQIQSVKPIMPGGYVIYWEVAAR